MANCGSCNAPVIWVRTSTGKRMPVDAAPVPNGNIILNGGQAVYTQAGCTIGAPDGKLYVSHFATCPNAKKHRKATA